MGMKYTRWQMFLYEKLILSKDYNIEELSRRMGIPASTLYNYVEGQSTCPPELIQLFYNATKDPDFLSFIINDTDYILVLRKAASSKKSTLEVTLDIASSTGQLISIVQKALKKGLIPNASKKEIITGINTIQKELEGLRRKIE